jgi:hypothetical protein
VNISPKAIDLEAVVSAEHIKDKEILSPFDDLSGCFRNSSKDIRIIVQEPEVTGKCI